MKCRILKVDQDYRISIQQTDLKDAGWVLGSEPVKAWLLVGGLGRFRLLSSAEFDNDRTCLSLRAAIDEEFNRPTGSAIEFRDEGTSTLGIRLLPVDITPPGPGWRLTLPKTLVAIMQIRPKESSVALLQFQNRLEIWTMETVRKSCAVPLTEII